MPYELINTTELVATNQANTNSTGYGILPQQNGVYVYPFKTSYSLIDQARENLILLLLTTRGERLYHSTFGSNLERLLFNNISDSLKDIIREDIIESVNMWLNYINILEVDIQTYEEDPSLEHEIVITINWGVGSNYTGEPVRIFSDSETVTAE